LKVTRAIGQGFATTHKGWPVIAVIFVFYGVIRFFSAPNDDIPPYLKSLGDWGIAALIFAALCIGANYIMAGVQAFARDGIIEGRYEFKRFFGNCNRYFLVQLGVSSVLSIPMWALLFLAAVFRSGLVLLVILVPAALGSESWSIAAADSRGVFRSIGRSFIFCGGKFFGITGLLLLVFVSTLLISVVVWISYAFILQEFRYLGLEGYGFILREVTGCALYAYFFLFSSSSLMAYYLNNRKADERHN
jgi:hypothetical protein